jgi:hypothetical protein
MGTCQFCGKDKLPRSLKMHERTCPDNENRILSAGNTGKKGKNSYTKALELGLPRPVMEDNTKKKISEAALSHNRTYWSEENRDKHSERMLLVVKQYPDSYNYDNVCRRVQRFEYAGEYLHSSWEVLVAEYLDENKIEWERKVRSFDYVWEDKTRQYFPDFYLPKFDIYLEVKGYEIEKDREKWKQFPKRLILIKFQEIEKILNKSFNIFELIG